MFIELAILMCHFGRIERECSAIPSYTRSPRHHLDDTASTMSMESCANMPALKSPAISADNPNLSSTPQPVSPGASSTVEVVCHEISCMKSRLPKHHRLGTIREETDPGSSYSPHEIVEQRRSVLHHLPPTYIVQSCITTVYTISAGQEEEIDPPGIAC